MKMAVTGVRTAPRISKLVRPSTRPAAQEINKLLTYPIKDDGKGRRN
jgi:hypothetical protein